ncbi:unnamed protein product [Rotaria sp. Silwood2]|nr:unnamed protein product [Rotaria sp. Silwood2]CAF4061408.1 unnamed protein product [Rotaria sp. Silwood2]
MTLQEIDWKLETLHDLAHKGKKFNQDRLDQLEHGRFWSWLFDEGDVGIVKYKRNLEHLANFGDFLQAAINSIGEVTSKLQLFKSEAEQLQENAVNLEYVPNQAVEIQTEMLNAALKRLKRAKDAFMSKKEQIGRSHGDDDFEDKKIAAEP